MGCAKRVSNGISSPSTSPVCYGVLLLGSLIINTSAAGLFSSTASHVLMSRVRFPQAVAELISKSRLTAGMAQKEATKVTSEAVLPSLGASGAIYGTVTLTALAFPDTQIALIFPPTWPIPIQWGVGGLVALDIIGALRGWR